MKLAVKVASASAEIRHTNGDPFYRVTSVRSAHPGQGHATALMIHICNWADERGFELWLEAQRNGNPDGTLTNKELERFYSKFGFKVVPNGAKPAQMLRAARKKNNAYSE